MSAHRNKKVLKTLLVFPWKNTFQNNFCKHCFTTSTWSRIPLVRPFFDRSFPRKQEFWLSLKWTRDLLKSVWLICRSFWTKSYSTSLIRKICTFPLVKKESEHARSAVLRRVKKSSFWKKRFVSAAPFLLII